MMTDDQSPSGAPGDDAAVEPVRKIIHVDMDAFFASVEQRDNPELRGKPVAVGGSSKRGVVAAASYEARKFGVKSAMPSVTAARRCPDLIFVRHRFDVYGQVSSQIREIFDRYTDLIEPLSLDEAYLDVTSDKQGIGSATLIAEKIRDEIRNETQLTASAGVSYNKFIAKIASDQNKPDGICVIRPEDGPKFVTGLPVRRFHGVGPRTAEKMAGLGIETGADLRAQELEWLQQRFGKFATYLFHAARGVDHRPVKPHRRRKSVGGERTYGNDLFETDALHTALDEIVRIVWERIERNKAEGRTVILKVKYADFQQVTRSQSLDHLVTDRAEFSSIGHDLLKQLLPLRAGVRLLGLTLGSLKDDEKDNGESDQSENEPLQQQFPF